MSVEFDYEIFEMFKDQFLTQLPVIEQNILMLNNEAHYSEALDDLFRYFHNYKATASYLGLTHILELVTKTESVLNILRDDNLIVDESIIEWLLKVKDQMDVWTDEMELGVKKTTPVNPDLLNAINLTSSSKKPSEIIKEMDMLYVDFDANRANKIVAALSKLMNKVQLIDSKEKLAALQKNPNHFNIALLNVDKYNFSLIDKISNLYKKISFIVVFDKLNSARLMKLGLQGVSHTLTNPIKGSELKKELLLIASNYHADRRVLINNKKIVKFISELQPLPNTLLQIQQICDDDELGLSELIPVIKQDPVITGSLLNAASSPIYGLKSVSTIDQAVKAFGKRTVKALVLDQLSNLIGETNLKAYNIDDEIFSQVSAMRLSLMIAWYSKVSVAALGVLSSTAILGNLGQLLIAKEIDDSGQNSEFFSEIQKSGIQIAEEKFMHTTTAYVTSDILRFWQLPSDVVDSIRFSDNPLDAPLEIQHLALANHIVYNLVTLTGHVLSELSDDIYYQLSQNGLDPQPLEAALATLQKNIK